MTSPIRMRWYVSRNKQPTEAEIWTHASKYDLSIEKVEASLVAETQPRLQYWDSFAMGNIGEWVDVPTEIEVFGQ